MVSKAVGLDIPPLEFALAVSVVSGALDQSSSRTLVVNPVMIC